MKKLSVKNYNKAKLLNIFIYSFLMISFFIPLLIILFLESSEIAQVLMNNPLILIFLISLQIYFFYLGSYYSKIKIDQYIINIFSSRTNSQENLLDIKHDMLKSYHIKKSMFSWNTIVYITFIKKKNNYITRKFYFSLMNDDDKKKVILYLDNILNKNE
tara:strand:- start:1258 stop:1734 length:477 start_codon:yes stop_codon:yes gene_type:complete